MFDFDRPEYGSEQRYEERVHEIPPHILRPWWVVHNLVAHPLIALFPCRITFDFHDYTSERMQGL